MEKSCRFALISLLFWGCTTALAQAPELSELDALRLADDTPEQIVTRSDWRRLLELGVSSGQRQRLAVDGQYDHALAPGWRALLAARWDGSRAANSQGQDSVLTLKEAYLSHSAAEGESTRLWDLGRVNVRQGVAWGYNPTDYFRSGAVRAATSITPASLKENRQGSVMLRGQTLWAEGAVTALFAPKLSDQPSSAGFSPDWGATNPRARGLLTWSQALRPGLAPQWLLYQEEGQGPQLGVNLTGLINDNTVAYLEYSGGRSPRQLDAANFQNTAPPQAWHNHLASGLSYTAPSKLTLNLEYHYNSAAPDAAQWQALQTSPLYGPYRSWAQNAQELPTRAAWFLFATWQGALTPRLDLSLMHNHAPLDHSHRTWLEARYHQTPFEYLLQWQINQGSPLSTYGALPESRTWQGVVRYYW